VSANNPQGRTHLGVVSSYTSIRSPQTLYVMFPALLPALGSTATVHFTDSLF
jgi:hypothetical protein